MNCLIVDSELMARKYLKKLCAKIPELKVIQVCGSLDSAFEIIQRTEIDLLFIDIELSNQKYLKKLNVSGRTPNLIVTFAHDGVDINAFDSEVTTFIKKPISFPRFKEVMDRVFSQFAAKAHSFQDAEEIFVKEQNRFIRVRFDDIIYIENIGDYAKIVTPNSSMVTYGTIKAIAEKLPDKYFVRVHRSYIVNWRKIIDIEANSLIVPEKVIPVSRKLRSTLMGRLNVL